MIQTHIMQSACSINRWISGDWHACVFDPVTGLVGEAVFGLMIGAALYISLYLAGNGRSTTPTVVTILVATLLFPTLPGQYKGIAWSVLMVGGAAAIMQSLQKYLLSPSTTR